MLNFLFSAWRAGLRSRSIQAVLVLGVLLMGVAYLAAQFTFRQAQTVAMDVGFSGLRISLTLFALFWVQELFGREIERRSVMFALTYPVPRSQYVLGRYLGIVLLLGLSALLLGLLLWLVVLLTRGLFEQVFPIQLGSSYWLAVVGFWVDAAVVAAFAFWFTSLSTVPMLPLALGLAFAIGGKSLGAVVEYLSHADAGQAMLALKPLIDAIQWVLPDLSRLDWRVSPMYALPMDTAAMGWSLVMAAAYAGLMIALAVWSFQRRQFH
ncbi:MAG TPA: ABC-2 transporter permease [Rhodocyclaceae bacterium]|jgi:ABC-type transport system involved in multi-copper enzyme maturation permease subunit|nr:ABC-2 transporter permease [Rhodocyclaceae bacterium]